MVFAEGRNPALARVCGLFGLWIAGLLERYRGAAGTVSRGCWNGIAGLLERYRGAAGTVSSAGLSPLRRLLGQVQPLRSAGLLFDVHQVAANLVAKPLAVGLAGLCHSLQRLA